jgi:uncharacterized paraquat-inducible protein A
MLQLKLKRSLSKRQLLAFIVLGFLVVAAQLPLTHAQVVPQGYKTDETLQRGMLVMLKEGDTSKIPP